MSPPTYWPCENTEPHEAHVHVIDHGSHGVYGHWCPGVTAPERVAYERGVADERARIVKALEGMQERADIAGATHDAFALLAAAIGAVSP